ncbi:MAG: DUF4292 domain-containing protein [Vicingaceae bacterium]
MRISALKYISVALSLLFLLACGSKEKASRKPLEGNNADYLLKQMKANEFDFDTFSAKAEFSMQQDGKKNSFKANIRIKKDSLIWISITPLLGIELGRVMITQDTVKVINRIAKEYFVGDFRYIENRFNIKPEYDLMQALLLGNSIQFVPDEKLKFGIDKEFYYLGNLKKRKAKKADEKPKKIEKEEDEVVSLWLDQNTFKVREFLLSDLSADRFLTGSYKGHTKVEEQWLPRELHFDIQSDDPALLDIEYSRVYLNKSLNFAFNISSKYEQVFY